MTSPPHPAGPAPGATVLALAARALADIAHAGRTADDALAAADPPPAGRPAVRAILYGALRGYLRLAPAVDVLRGAERRAPQPLLQCLLVAGLHQLEYSRSPPQSVVNIAVDAARVLGHGAASGFVNALLRRFLRERDAVWARVDRSPAAAVAHPRWMLRELEAAWPAEAAAIVQANNEPPPMTLRVDLSRGSRDDYRARLAAAGIEAVDGLLPTALVLAEPVGVERLPGFAEGAASVQDAGAQLAAFLLDAQPGERVLDACAAPGGKAGHLLEHTPGLAELVAVDRDARRLARVADNLARLGRSATLVQADLTEEVGWWDGRPFDRILLDAPCSGSGVIRRHPDIKLLRRPADLAGFAATQRALLQRLAPLLRPGGRLVYATCSVFPAENAAVVDAVTGPGGPLRRLRPETVSVPPGFTLSARADLHLLPAQRSAGAARTCDGFHYACLTTGGSEQQ